MGNPQTGTKRENRNAQHQGKEIPGDAEVKRKGTNTWTNGKIQESHRHKRETQLGKQTDKQKLSGKRQARTDTDLGTDRQAAGTEEGSKKKRREKMLGGGQRKETPGNRDCIHQFITERHAPYSPLVHKKEQEIITTIINDIELWISRDYTATGNTVYY